MENFDWTKFTLRIPVSAPINEVYDAWAISSQVERWFLSSCRYMRSDGTELPDNSPASEGDSYSWQWYAYDVTETGKIVEANGKDRFSFTFAGDCIVEIVLSNKGNHTLVELTQRNIPTDEKSKRNIRIGCHTGWSFFLVNLKSVLEGGIDLRNKDNSLRGMLNN